MESSNEFLPYQLEPAPEIIYKFRSWSDLNHRKMITHNMVWFSHPFQLNDVFELRPPTNIIIDRLTSYDAYRHLWDCLVIGLPDMPKKERVKLLKIKFAEITRDPVNYFLQGITVTEQNKEDYNVFGVLSMSMNPYDETLWAHYGANNTGFCIGFHRDVFIVDMNCLDGRVIYSNEPIDYDPMIIASGEQIANGFFQKSLKWKNEEEYRFLAVPIIDEMRVRTFSKDSVAEIILGYQISKEDEQAIIQESHAAFDTEVPIYKIKKQANSFIFKKELLG